MDNTWNYANNSERGTGCFEDEVNIFDYEKIALVPLAGQEEKWAA